MARLIYGDRITTDAVVLVGASAMIVDATGEKVLLTRRADNGRWCLPGGRLDAGESISETCTREVLEETGLEVKVGQLVGVYSDPNMLLTYPDGNRYQLIAFHFATQVTGGTIGLSNETTDVGYFAREEIAELDLMDHHRIRIEDAFERHQGTLVR